MTELQNNRITERQSDRMTEGQTGQIQYNPHFFKAGYNYHQIGNLSLLPVYGVLGVFL